MPWVVEFTEGFETWWETLDEDEQVSVAAVVGVLEIKGPSLPFPYRVLYAFDPRRVAILLIGGSKVGDDRWYEAMVPRADKLYDDHLRTVEEEGSPDG